MTPHYFSKEQTSPASYKLIESRLRGNALQLRTASGVFSKDAIDLGTRLLIEKSVIKPGWKALDLGAGYGAVGIAIAKAFPATEVILREINERAAMLCAENCRLNKVRNASVSPGSMLDGLGEFDTILLNPPQSAGRKLCEEMIVQSKAHLTKGGCLQMVARHRKGGETLSEFMKSVFGNVEDTAKGGGYRIYISRA